MGKRAEDVTYILLVLQVSCGLVRDHLRHPAELVGRSRMMGNLGTASDSTNWKAFGGSASDASYGKVTTHRYEGEVGRKILLVNRCVGTSIFAGQDHLRDAFAVCGICRNKHQQTGFSGARVVSVAARIEVSWRTNSFSTPRQAPNRGE